MVYELVDERDRLVRLGTKEDALRLGLWRRVVHIFVFDRHGKLLICRRPPTVSSYPNMITSSAGGHVECDEPYRAAAKRELFEELGLRAKLTDMGRFDVVGRRGKIIHHLFSTHASAVSPAKDEIRSFAFISLSGIRRDIARHPRRYAFPFREAFNFYLRSKSKPIQR